MPTHLQPMLTTLVNRPFRDPAWLFETKWDGVRALCYVKGGTIQLKTRNGKEVAFRYPELADIAGSIDAAEAVLDGEIITLDAQGRSVFQWLQSRIGLKGEADIAAAARAHPALYCAFDLLYCDGYDLCHEPLAARKESLTQVVRPAAGLRLSDTVVGDGEQRFRAAERQGLEGIIAKLGSSPHEGGRSRYWLKIKTMVRQEVVIAGYTAPRGSRKLLGALLVGVYDGGVLRYVGHVGGGFDRQSLAQVYNQLQPLKTHTAPFDVPPTPNEPVQWVKPQLVGEVKFAAWTAATVMRQPIFLGLRDDKRPEECRVERPHEVRAEKAKAPETGQAKAMAKDAKETGVSLQTYWHKRDFRQTAEPKGRRVAGRDQTIFVIHEHHASVLHFDLRLEIAGVLKSWSVPKGPTLDPTVKRLAVEVEDHPLAYASFDGTIPEGQYGAGRSLIWDEGRVAIHEPDPLRAWEEGHLSFTLAGSKLRGAFALVRMHGRKGKPQWLLMKKNDAEAQADWHLDLVEPDGRFMPDMPGQKPARARSTPASASGKKKATKPRQRTASTATRAAKPISPATLLKREPLEGNVSLKVGKHTVELTHLEKLYWPQEQITKGALLRYYLQVGTTIMPYLKGRPAVLKRYPNGINDTGFFQHDVTSGPAYLQTEALTNEQGRRLHYAVYTDLASLLYLVNLGTIDQHVWLARVGSLDEPDYVVFDLDPKGAPFRNVLTVARLMHGMLGDLEMTGCVKTSGSSGIHIFIPVKRGYTFEQTRHWAEQMAREVASRAPKVATTERSLAARTKAQVYIDWQQNASGKTIAAPYTIRPKPRATVSAPVTWDEVEVGFRLTDFTIATMSERMQEVGDVWAGPRWRRQTLPDLA